MADWDDFIRRVAEETAADEDAARAQQNGQAASPNGHDVEPLAITVAADLAGKPVPEREWLVPDWIPSRQVTLLSGDGGVGKSLLAMQLQIAAAAHCQCLGLPVSPCRSFGIYAQSEGDELHPPRFPLTGL